MSDLNQQLKFRHDRDRAFKPLLIVWVIGAVLFLAAAVFFAGRGIDAWGVHRFRNSMLMFGFIFIVQITFVFFGVGAEVRENRFLGASMGLLSYICVIGGFVCFFVNMLIRVIPIFAGASVCGAFAVFYIAALAVSERGWLVKMFGVLKWRHPWFKKLCCGIAVFCRRTADAAKAIAVYIKTNRVKLLKILGCTAAAAGVIAVVITVVIPAARYGTAVKKIENGEYLEAYNILMDIRPFGKSEETLKELGYRGQHAAIKAAELGDTVYLGYFEQDDDISNGAEEIAWSIIDEKDGKVLLLSNYVLFEGKHSPVRMPITWESSEIRSYLNGEFFDEVFTPEDREIIDDTTVETYMNKLYGTDGGEDTVDKLFIFSFGELNKYMPETEDRVSVCTEYAANHGVFVGENGGCWWWLRSPGLARTTTMFLYEDGSVRHAGGIGHFDYRGVRPAMWIDLEKIS